MDSGRPAGDAAQSVLEAMNTLDALVRRGSSSDGHGGGSSGGGGGGGGKGPPPGPFLERLSAVYGQPQAAVKVSRSATFFV